MDPCFVLWSQTYKSYSRCSIFLGLKRLWECDHHPQPFKICIFVLVIYITKKYSYGVLILPFWGGCACHPPALFDLLLHSPLRFVLPCPLFHSPTLFLCRSHPVDRHRHVRCAHSLSSYSPPLTTSTLPVSPPLAYIAFQKASGSLLVTRKFTASASQCFFSH